MDGMEPGIFETNGLFINLYWYQAGKSSTDVGAAWPHYKGGISLDHDLYCKNGKKFEGKANVQLFSRFAEVI